MFKLMDKKIIAILRLIFLLNWSYDVEVSRTDTKCCTFLSSVSFQFEVEINNYTEEGMYILSFHNCYNFENKRSQAAINITVSVWC